MDIKNTLANWYSNRSGTDSVFRSTSLEFPEISIDQCIKDLNEGNILDSLNYLFSSSVVFDTLSFRGKVCDSYTLSSIKNIWVMLFKNDVCDSLIFQTTPNYVAKTNDDGLFVFPNLKKTNYNIVALSGFDFIYNQNEKIAFYEKSIIPEKDSFITLFAFEPKIKIDSASKLLVKKSNDD